MSGTEQSYPGPYQKIRCTFVLVRMGPPWYWTLRVDTKCGVGLLFESTTPFRRRYEWLRKNAGWGRAPACGEWWTTAALGPGADFATAGAAETTNAKNTAARMIFIAVPPSGR